MTSSLPSQGVLYDSDFIIALAVPDESTHALARDLFSQVEHLPVFMLRLIKYEVATVVSRKLGYVMAHNILLDLNQWSAGLLEIGDIEPAIWQEYYSHKRRNISFFDCANLLAARCYNLKIASFDSFYPKALRIA